jgi:hypothetical protein
VHDHLDTCSQETTPSVLDVQYKGTDDNVEMTSGFDQDSLENINILNYENDMPGMRSPA